MERADRIARRSLAQRGQRVDVPAVALSTEARDELGRELIADLWVYLADRYGEHFTRRCGTDPFPDEDGAIAVGHVWALELAGFAPDVIVRACKRYFREQPRFAPTLGDIRQRCEKESRDVEMYVLPFEQRLEEPPEMKAARRRIADEALAYIFAKVLRRPRPSVKHGPR